MIGSWEKRKKLISDFDQLEMANQEPWQIKVNDLLSLQTSWTLYYLVQSFNKCLFDRPSLMRMSECESYWRHTWQDQNLSTRYLLIRALIRQQQRRPYPQLPEPYHIKDMFWHPTKHKKGEKCKQMSMTSGCHKVGYFTENVWQQSLFRFDSTTRE